MGARTLSKIQILEHFGHIDNRRQDDVRCVLRRTHLRKFASWSDARRTHRHACPHQGPQRAQDGHTCVGSCQGVRRVGFIARGIVRHHGQDGLGVTLSWSCAGEVADFVAMAWKSAWTSSARTPHCLTGQLLCRERLRSERPGWRTRRGTPCGSSRCRGRSVARTRPPRARNWSRSGPRWEDTPGTSSKSWRRWQSPTNRSRPLWNGSAGCCWRLRRGEACGNGQHGLNIFAVRLRCAVPVIFGG